MERVNTAKRPTQPKVKMSIILDYRMISEFSESILKNLIALNHTDI